MLAMEQRWQSSSITAKAAAGLPLFLVLLLVSFQGSERRPFALTTGPSTNVETKEEPHGWQRFLDETEGDSSNISPIAKRKLCEFQHAYLRVEGPSSDDEAVHHKTIFFVGDSTMRNQFHALCRVGNVRPTQHAFPSELQTCTVSLPRQNVRRDRLVISAAFGSDIVAFGHHENPMYIRMMKFLQSKQAGIGGVGAGNKWVPDALYIGSGLWMQWPVPFNDLNRWPTYSAMKSIDEHLSAILSTATVPQIVLTTCHSICEDSFYGKWYSTLHNDTSRAQALAQCASSLVSEYNTDASQATEDCERGLRSRNSSRLISRQIQRTAKPFKISYERHHSRHGQQTRGRRRRHPNGNSTRPASRISVVDAFDLTDGKDKCRMNVHGDGMHFVGLIYDEIGMLLDGALRWLHRHNYPAKLNCNDAGLDKQANRKA